MDKLNILNKNSSQENSKKNPSTCPPIKLSKELQQIMLKIKSEFIIEYGRSISYAKLKTSALYGTYKNKALQLQTIDISQFTENQRKAFFINIYNALTIHGLLDKEILPKSILDLQKFWKITAYKIDSYTFTLDEIEHGILRGNKNHPGSSKILFDKNDPRLKFICNQFDPRIHFALTCGAMSCPIFRVYSEENINNELDIATKEFCKQEVAMESTMKEIKVSQLFQWYRNDFGVNDVDAIKWTLKYLEGNDLVKLKDLVYGLENVGGVTISYTPYNWMLNNAK